MEFASPVVSVVSCVAKVADPILKHVKYPFTAGDNTTALESAITKLQARRDDVEKAIGYAKLANGDQTREAREWLNDVEAIEKAAEQIQQEYNKLCRTTIEGEASHIQQEYEKRCLCNICPKNVWSAYKTSKMAAKKLVDVKRVFDEKPESIVQMPPAPLAQKVPASSSISPYLKPALACVKNDGESIIGIWGMGGAGKTHLLEQINNKLFENRAFEVIVFITCSEECSEDTVQRKILRRLGPLGIGSTTSREQIRFTIYKFLEVRSFVLLLDDLWSPVDLKKVGIPNPTGRQKVVLTTRSTEVCRQMGVKTNITVNRLEPKDAWSLFEENVTERTINSHSLIQEYALKIVNKLGGLPLALITVGKAMCDKTFLHEWENAFEELEQARSVLHKLQFSYDRLGDDTLKKCFLHCSLWPEVFQIPKDDVVNLWMGLGLIKKKQDIQAAYNIGYSYIGRLVASSLLEVDDDGGFIKMHCMIREMALRLTKDKWIVQAGPNTESNIYVSRGTETLSTMNTQATEFYFSTQCSSIKPTTLLLNYNYWNESIAFSPELFSELKILDLSHNGLKILPDDICKLVHLQFLNLSYNLFKSLPKELGDLTELKYLLLRGLTCIFPEWSLSKLKALTMLDFSNYNLFLWDSKLEKKYLEFFKTLTNEQFPDFQALGISIWDDQDFEKLCKKVSVPVRWLDVGRHEERCLSFSSSFFGNSQFRNVFSIDVKATHVVQHVEFEKKVGNEINCCLGRLEYLRFGSMWSMEKVIWKNLDPKNVFPRLQLLEFHECPYLSSISWVLNLPSIRELRVINCCEIKQLISIDDNGGQYSVPDLKKIHLRSNKGLESISDPIVTFPSLEILEVYGCDKLKKLPFNTGDLLRTLKKIKGPEKWWNKVEMADGNHSSSLDTFFEPAFSI